MRTDSNLVQRWNAAWGSDPHENNGDDYLYGVTEAIMNHGAGPADLVMVGATTSWGAGGSDLLIMRMDGCGTPLRRIVIGGPDDDEGRSVAELRSGTLQGDLVFAGSSRSTVIPPLAQLDAYVLEMDANLTFVRGDLIFGSTQLDDEARSIRPDPYAAFNPLTDPQPLIVTGYTGTATGTLLRQNVFLQRVNGGMGSLRGLGMIYGGTGDDGGRSVIPTGPFAVPAPPDTLQETIGYAVAGYNRSPNLIGNDPEQLYLIKVDTALRSGCNETEVLHIPTSPSWAPVPVQEWGVGLMTELRATIVANEVFWENDLCGGPNLRTERGADVEPGIAVTDPRSHIGETVSALSYPNPLRSGERLQVRFNVAVPGNVTVLVSDMSGHTIERLEQAYGTGAALVTIPTVGWAPGAYAVTIVAGDERAEAKVIVRGE